jgi:Protein of unknown function (DUF1320)
MAYATTEDLQAVGLKPTSLGTLTPAQVSANLQSASDFADSFFRARWGTFAVPLVAWDSQVTKAVAKISAFDLMVMRGLRADSTDWTVYRTGYDDAVAWLDKVQRQQAHPLVTLAASNLPGRVQPNINTASVVNLANGCTARRRGW